MTKTSDSLESAVTAIKANEPAEGQVRTARQRAEDERIYAAILRLLAPRFRHFIRQYGLAGHWDDAEQACAIAVHRAIQGYDPEKAQFTTFVNWQIRGELQSLRFRLMTDQRPSARKVAAVTVSLDAMTTNEDGDQLSVIAGIEDEDALGRTESGAADYLASSAMETLTNTYIDHLRKVGMDRLRRQSRAQSRAKTRSLAKSRGDEAGEMPMRSVWRSDNQLIDPAAIEELEEKLRYNRGVVEQRLFAIDAANAGFDDEPGIVRERARQIAKRAARTMCELAGLDPRFAMMAEQSQPNAPVAAQTMH